MRAAPRVTAVPSATPATGATGRRCHRSSTSRGGRSSTRAATPPSRSRCSSPPAPPAGPSSRRARPPASSRRSSSATAATATAARASPRAVAHVNDEIADALEGMEALDQRGVDLAAHRPRRLAEQGQPRRQRAARHQPGGGPRRRRGDRAAAVALRRRRQRPRAAGADDERAQRRRPRRQQRRLPGVHDHAGRRGVLLRGRCAGAPRPTTPSRALLHDAGLSTAVGDEGGFAPDLPSNEDALPLAGPGHRAGGLRARRADRHRPRPGVHRVLRATARYVLAGEGRTLTPAEMVDEYARLCAAYPIVSIEDGMAEEDWDGWAADHPAARRHGAAGGRRPLRHQRRAPRARHRGRRGQLDPREGEPDRHAHRDARHRRHGAPRRVHRGDVAPLGRDRGRHHRRPRRRHQLRADQGRRAGPLRPGGQVQPAAPHRDRARRHRRLPRRAPRLGRGSG